MSGLAKHDLGTADRTIRPEPEDGSTLRGPHIDLSKPGRFPSDHDRLGLDGIENVQQLEESLSEPSAEVLDVLGRLKGDILFLGAGGKIGPSLVRMARRASDAAGVSRRIIALSRFTDAGSRSALEADGIETVVCDLLNPDHQQRLPVCANVVLLAGMKFGATGREPATWATNCYLPAIVSQCCKGSRFVAFSTGNVYSLTPVGGRGSLESDVPTPVGEYAMSCLGRERLLEYFSAMHASPTAILRLNYACDLRYGVLVDLAEKVWSGEPIDLSMGYVNVIWQGDANAMVLSAFEHVTIPPLVINIAGADVLSVREVCQEFGELFGKSVTFEGEPAGDAFLSNNARSRQLLAAPRWTAADLVRGVAAWVQRGGQRLGKPTYFQSRSGKF